MRGRLVGWNVVAVAVVAAAMGVAASTGGATAAPPDANLVAARAAAQRIVALTPLPPGAVAQPSDPSAGAALSQVYEAHGPQQVIRTRYWTVSGTPGSASDFIYAHPPAGSSLYAEAGPVPPSPTSSGWQEERSFPGTTGRVTSELLQLTTAPARGGGTAIRADAIILWRPTWEQVPAGARAGRVRLDGFAQRTVTGAGLARLRALVATSPVVAPGGYACPAGFPGQAMRVTFLDGHGRPLAHIGADSADGCVWLAVTVGARRGPALQNGWGLAPRLWAAGSLIRCTAAQLAVSVAAPSVYRSGATATITVRNVARAPCSVKGFPTVKLLAATGRRLPVADRRMSGPPSVVTAAGRATLSATVTWPGHSGRCARPAPAVALVGVPGVRHRFAVTLKPSRQRLGPCAGPLGISPLGWL